MFGTVMGNKEYFLVIQNKKYREKLVYGCPLPVIPIEINIEKHWFTVVFYQWSQ